MLQDFGKYYVSWDCGQRFDYSAVAVIQPVHIRHESRLEKPIKEYRVHELDRIRDMPYWWVVEKLKTLMTTLPYYKNCRLILDATSMDPLTDELRRQGVPHIGVKVTGADHEKVAEDSRYEQYNVPKMHIATALQLLFENDQLKIPKTLKLGATLKQELYNARHKRTPSGKESFDHPEGEHDDLLFACGLAAWAARKFGAVMKTVEPEKGGPYEVPSTLPFVASGFRGWDR